MMEKSSITALPLLFEHGISKPCRAVDIHISNELQYMYNGGINAQELIYEWCISL